MVEPIAQQGEKIILMGLDNSGKTSILLCLQGEQNLMTYYSLKPTLGIQISEIKGFNEGFYVWDFGGQETYRHRYFKDFTNYLEQATRLIYVIDIQDRMRMGQALAYFEQIMEYLKKGKYNVKVSVYLHKYDPALEFDDKNRESLERYTRDLVTQLKELASPSVNILIFKSTIYTVFRKSMLP
jgi:GTPase SAR1 family protein